MSRFMFVALLPLLLVALFTMALCDDICSEVNCGKGTCKASVIPLVYTCECDAGWRRTRLSDNEEQYLQFLPCIIPNCTITSCMPAAPPLPAIPTDPFNESFYDPCEWIYCGEGTCTNSSSHIHTCKCDSGAFNILNVSVFPCYSDCAIGSDCSSLGIKLSSSSPSPSSGSGSSTGSGLSSVSPKSASSASMVYSGMLNGIVSLLISFAMIPWKLNQDF
ncbi:hypothetical protein Droror1_Dr00024778 [Drosera rotundifolia]